MPAYYPTALLPKTLLSDYQLVFNFMCGGTSVGALCVNASQDDGQDPTLHYDDHWDSAEDAWTGEEGEGGGKGAEGAQKKQKPPLKLVIMRGTLLY